jgi:hypothetical protein
MHPGVFIIIYIDDRLGGTIALASATLHTNGDIDMGLGFAFSNGLAFTPYDTGST